MFAILGKLHSFLILGSTFIAILLPAVWVRSYFVSDSASLELGNGKHIGGSSGRGWVEVGVGSVPFASTGSFFKVSRWRVGHVRPADTLDSLQTLEETGGIKHVYRVGSAGFGRVYFSAIRSSVNVLQLPLWSLVAAALFLPLNWLRRRRRDAFVIRSGKCLHCGYDLRATPGRCPECGALPVSVQTA